MNPYEDSASISPALKSGPSVIWKGLVRGHTCRAVGYEEEDGSAWYELERFGHDAMGAEHWTEVGDDLREHVRAQVDRHFTRLALRGEAVLNVDEPVAMAA